MATDETSRTGSSRYGGAGLILESTFRSVPDLGQELFPWLPVRAIVTYDVSASAPRTEPGHTP